MPLELPLAGPALEPHERADAARNRERILQAASDLVAEHGIEAVSMQAIARGAHVGAGTVYRRFGDRAGLALALLDESTQAFQEELLRGEPPLGPGAPAADRLCAFGERYLEFLDEHAALIMAGEPRNADDGRGPASFYLTHLAMLLREAVPQLDAEHTARVLLSGFGPREHVLLRGPMEWPLERLQRNWSALVGALTSPGGS